MQKKLLTLAVAGALGAPGAALAQSSVEVYGTINMAFGNFKYSTATNGHPGVTKWDVANGASNYGLRGRESLGGGLTAWFQIEQNAPLERSSEVSIKPASRNSAVGIQGAWGNAFIGQWTSPWADLDGLWSVGTVGFWGPVTSIIGRRETTGVAPNPNCVNPPAGGGGLGTALAGSPWCSVVEAVGGVGHPFWRRMSNSVFYQSPVFSGFQVKLGLQPNEGKAGPSNNAGTSVVNDASMWSGSIQWAGMGGAARIGLAMDRHKDFTTVGKTDTGWALKGGYNFGIADLGLAWEQMTYNTATGDTDAKQWAVALGVPVGTGAIKGSYSRAKARTNVAAGANETGARQYNLGYEHRFSKRTNIGFGYAKIDNDANAVFTWTGSPVNQSGASNTPPAGSDVSTWFVSITHRF